MIERMCEKYKKREKREKREIVRQKKKKKNNNERAVDETEKLARGVDHRAGLAIAQPVQAIYRLTLHSTRRLSFPRMGLNYEVRNDNYRVLDWNSTPLEPENRQVP